MSAKLYLIPSTLGESPIENVIPIYNKEIINKIKIYIVEEIRTARRFLKKAGIVCPIDDLTFYILNEHTKPEEISGYLSAIKQNENIGLLSEAGLPAIADPGAMIVKMAHEMNIPVVPLTGPSSLFLALMASGMNGQNFAFNGYLPVKPDMRRKQILQFEKKSQTEKQTQLFIEAPYRNMQLFQDILDVCQGSTQLCIACDITLDSEFIKTQSVSEWKKQTPDLHKKPCIFILSRS